METENSTQGPVKTRTSHKGKWFVLLLIALGAVGFWSIQRQSMVRHAHDAGTAQTDQLYTCGMHPQMIRREPGNCPICGMKLVPVRKQPAALDSILAFPTAASGEHKAKYYKSTMIPGEIRQTPGKDSMGMEMVPVYEEAGGETSILSIDPVTIQNMGIRTGVVTKGPLRRTIRTVAVVAYDETALAEVTTKFKGWIVKLYVDATGQQVHRGEPLFDIYSPELYSAQMEYLAAQEDALDQEEDLAALRANALTRLGYFDISDDQLAALQKTRQVRKTLRVDAPRDGVIVEKKVVEGQMVEEGMTLYRIADLGRVWVLAQVFEQDVPFIRVGQEALVSLSYLPDRKFRGLVTFVYPTVDEKTRTVGVRMEFHNPGYFLKPGMFTTVELRAELVSEALLVPDMAVLRSGKTNTVFVALKGGKFDPRTIVLGPRGENDQYQVLSGLAEGERVVTSGQFMLDSESQLREAIQKMLNPVSPAEEPDLSAAAAGQLHADMTSVPPPLLTVAAYVCPMPEHIAIQYLQAGKCPLCSMELVPVSAAQLAQIRPGEVVDHYTCPMPEHADIRTGKSGKCPKCGMTLIPIMKVPDVAEPAPFVDHSMMDHH